MASRFNLAEALLSDHADRTERIALREPARQWTYGELATQVAKVASALTARGVLRGDRVVVFAPDCLEAAAALLGVIHMGGIAVPLSELSRSSDLRAYVNDSGAVAAIIHDTIEPIIDEVRHEMPSLREIIVIGKARDTEKSYEELVGKAQPMPACETSHRDPALILYSTTASRSSLRGVLHSQAAPMASYRAYAEGVLGMTESDRVLSTAKLATAYGLGAGLIFPLACGAESILLAAQPRSRTVIDVLRTLHPTIMFATPSLYGQLLVDVEKQQATSGKPATQAREKPPALASVRICVSGGEALPAGLAGRISVKLGLEILAGYGLTAAFHFVLSNPIGKTKPGSSGVWVPGYSARIVDDDRQPVAASVIGTLEISGPSIGLGYWNRPEETKTDFHDELLNTGDRFLVDKDGYYFHCGRTDDLFKVGGRWVSPEEVEQTLLVHESVWECAVTGVEDANGLTKPLAFVVPNVGHAPGPELEKELIEFVKREIAPYKYPRWIEFVDQLPKGPQGKVLRYKLNAKLRKRRAATTTS